MESLSDDLAWLKLIELSTLMSLPMTIKAAINLNVFDILTEQECGPDDAPKQLTAAQIISHMQRYNARTRLPSFDAKRAAAALDRILRVLVSHSVLSCSASSSDLNRNDIPFDTIAYGATPICKYLVTDKMSTFFFFFTGQLLMEAGQHLPAAVLEGAQPFTVAQGTDFFTYTTAHPRFNALFHSAMASASKMHMAALLRSYFGFDGVSSFVDVGGGVGMTSSMILHQYPNIKAINFDLPHVIETACPYPGVQHVAGDMFVKIPQAEVCFLKYILHDWDDEHCIMLLKRCFEAIPPHGKVIIVDIIQSNQVNTSLRDRIGYQWDVIMMVVCQGGKERTEDEFKALAISAGFTNVKLLCSCYELSVMELQKF